MGDPIFRKRLGYGLSRKRKRGETGSDKRNIHTIDVRRFSILSPCDPVYPAGLLRGAGAGGLSGWTEWTELTGRTSKRENNPVEPEPLIPKHGGYRKLKSFQIAQLCFDALGQRPCASQPRLKRGTSGGLGHHPRTDAAPSGRHKMNRPPEMSHTSRASILRGMARRLTVIVPPRWGFIHFLKETQAGAPSSLDLGWLVQGLWPTQSTDALRQMCLLHGAVHCGRDS